ncbi:hypothetical protein BO71DRAFT_419320 [Aspergillus ellipticus CBS 707.79]|uniref:DJ-1/PfpI domain-containing protein n=1 Tax=Aspergillus ellipticus CBS 707.79 TaxID=1448320 RepID=A0A319DBA6_9EURO|nr:hypothetical protein BO71DRAFT_419320 [Aspergillus ellipticus CBS 707.79]
MSAPFDLRNPGRPIHVGVVLLNTVTEHLDVAPVGFFNTISKGFVKTLPDFFISDELRAQALDFVFHWVTEDGKTPGALTGNLNVVPTDSFASCPTLDIVFMGASQAGYQSSTTEKEFLRKCYSDCSAFLSVCVGFESILTAGILEGKTATAPRKFLPILQKMAPGTNWVDKRWVQDGKIWTTGELLNGLDMVATFGKETWGGEGSLVEYMIRDGSFPTRDVDYKDELKKQWATISDSCAHVRGALEPAIYAGPARSGASPRRKHAERAPVEDYTDHGRCAKFGYTCTTTNSPQSTTHNDDVVSKLFQDKPIEKDQSARLYEMHRSVFQNHSIDEAIPGSPATSTDTTPSVTTPTCEAGSGRFNVSMQEAEELLSQFRQRREYFPFIEVPDSTSAAAMAASRPFLLLAILTISLTRKPSLQKRIDERFRRVLSERIVFHGEKSMDYVQGLLVYLAWCPLNLRPLNNQVSQFLQILGTMISDLKLTENLHDGAARDACLGCYSLSSLLSVSFRRVGDDAAYNYLKAALDANRTLNQPFDNKLKYSTLQTLFETIFRSQETCSTEGCPTRKSQRVQEMIESHRLELQIFQRTQGCENIPLHLSALSLKVNIASLPFKVFYPMPRRTNKLKSSPIPSYQDPSLLDHAASCLSEIRNFFESFLFIPRDQYIYFSIREWCQLIVTISTASHICFLPVSTTTLEWEHFQTKARSSMLIYLESLSHRASTLSVSKAGDHPDTFFMFKSVLDIVLSTYAPTTRTTSSQTSATSGTESPETQGNGTDVVAPRTKSSRCPMMNGSIKQSEFWEAMEQSDLRYLESLGIEGDGEYTGTTGIPDMENLFDDAGDWPSIFSEWVNFSN